MRPDPERGAALITVMVVGALIMVLVVGIAGRVVSEARAVEDSLTQIRANGLRPRQPDNPASGLP